MLFPFLPASLLFYFSFYYFFYLFSSSDTNMMELMGLVSLCFFSFFVDPNDIPFFCLLCFFFFFSLLLPFPFISCLVMLISWISGLFCFYAHHCISRALSFFFNCRFFCIVFSFIYLLVFF